MTKFDAAAKAASDDPVSCPHCGYPRTFHRPIGRYMTRQSCLAAGRDARREDELLEARERGCDQ